MAKSKLAAESELNETIRREGMLNMLRNNMTPSPNKGMAPLNISAITRSESPFGISDYDIPVNRNYL